MKKFVSLLLALVLTVAVALPAMADSRDVVIDLTLTNVFEQSTSEWYSEDASRVLLATCVLMDVALGDDEALNELAVDAVASNKCYVAISADQKYLVIMFYGSEECLSVIYDPATGTSNCSVIESSPSVAATVMSGLKEDGTIASYYNIPGEDILTMLQILVDALEG